MQERDVYRTCIVSNIRHVLNANFNFSNDVSHPYGIFFHIYSFFLSAIVLLNSYVILSVFFHLLQIYQF